MIEINKIHQGDCLELFKQVDDNTVDLVVTSPPYNVSIEYDIYDDNLPWDKYYAWCRQWLKEIFRVLKPDGRFCLNHYFSFGGGENRYTPLMDLNWIATKELGFKHHGLAVWEDRTLSKRTAWGSWLSCSAPYISLPYEGILILYKEVWKKQNSGESDISAKEFMESCSGIWKLHPEMKGLTMANFPVSLPMRCIKMFTYKDDLVLDPFMGSGTTAYAAKMTERNYIGFELSEKYCKIANKRLEQDSLLSFCEKEISPHKELFM